MPRRDERHVQAREVMTIPVRSVREDTSLEEIARLLLEHGIGGVPVVGEDGKLRGIVSRSDFEVREQTVPFSFFRAPQLFGKWLTNDGLKAIYDEGRRLRAKDIMSSPVIAAREEDTLADVVGLMMEHEVNRIPIVRGEVPVGIISRRTLLELTCGKLEESRPA